MRLASPPLLPTSVAKCGAQSQRRQPAGGRHERSRMPPRKRKAAPKLQPVAELSPVKEDEEQAEAGPSSKAKTCGGEAMSRADMVEEAIQRIDEEGPCLHPCFVDRLSCPATGAGGPQTASSCLSRSCRAGQSPTAACTGPGHVNTRRGPDSQPKNPQEGMCGVLSALHASVLYATLHGASTPFYSIMVFVLRAHPTTASHRCATCQWLSSSSSAPRRKPQTACMTSLAGLTG